MFLLLIMKALLEYIQAHNSNASYELFSKTIGEVRFELDEASIEFLTDDFKELIFEMGKYPEKYNNHNRNKSYRVIWTSNDKDTLRLSDHGNERLDRPEEKGGDGEHIDMEEIKNMFIYAWSDIMEMYYDGNLSKDNEGNDRWVIQCKCYLKGSERNLFAAGARPDKKNLWAVFTIHENYNTGKLDITIVTLFRGEFLKHRRNQERIVIANSGYIKQKLPK